jgi:hypothetical protein
LRARPTRPRRSSISAKEIRAKIVGRALTDEVRWSRHFERGGRLASIDLGSRIRPLENEGGRLCFAVERGEPLDCDEIRTAAREIRLRPESGGQERTAVASRGAGEGRACAPAGMSGACRRSSME